MEEIVPGADPEQVAPAGQPFVLARPGTPVARIAADLKAMPLDEARRAYVVVETGAGAYAVVGAWELNDALAAAGPARNGRKSRSHATKPISARVSTSLATALRTITFAIKSYSMRFRATIMPFS